jgi:hypothetical protein
MNLYELFDAALSDLEPMADQVPAAQRIGRRKQELRRSGLAAVGAAFVIGAGTLVIAAPWSDNTGLAPGSVVTSGTYSSLVTSTLNQLWPAADRGTLAQAQVHFGAGLVPLPFMTQAFPPVPPALGIEQLSASEAAADKPCPTISPAAAVAFFCSESTLADGTIVMVSNTTEFEPYDIDDPGSNPAESFAVAVAPFHNVPAISSSAPLMVPFGTSGITSVVSLTVWKGDSEETLYLPYDFVATPSNAELTAIGESSAFQKLLASALAEGLVPSPGQTPTAQSSEMGICGTATAESTYTTTPPGGADSTASEAPGYTDPFVPVAGCPND